MAFKNPAFAQGLSNIAAAIAGDPIAEAKTEAYIADARWRTAQANLDIQTQENVDALRAAIEGGDYLGAIAAGGAAGNDYTARLPNLIGGAMSLPGTTVAPEDRAVFAADSGIQNYADTQFGGREKMRSEETRSRISAGPGYAAVRQRAADEAAARELQRALAGDELVAVVGEDGRSTYVATRDALGATPVISKSDALGGIVQTAAPDILAGNALPREVLEIADAISGGETRAPRNYITPSGAKGGTLDGVTDAATGEPLPQGTQTFTGAVQSDSTEPFYTTATQTGLEGTVQALDDFTALADDAVNLAETNPDAFGVTGRVNRFLQDARAQGQVFQEAFGTDITSAFDEATAELSAAGVDPKFYRPGLTQVDQVATILAYSAAAAVADQTGRGLSDRDFLTFREIVGNPSDFFASPQKFTARVSQLQNIVERRARLANERLSSGTVQVSPPAAPSGGAPTRLLYNPETGKIE